VEEIPEEYTEKTIAREWKPLQQGDPQPGSNSTNRAADISASRSIGTGLGVGSAGKSATAKAGGATYAVGESVNHKVFGNGMILKATKMGGDTLLEIAFEKVGTKKVFASFANLKKL
jgi:DNA helicase-2/ATP-dependent DNA helicase PcrA